MIAVFGLVMIFLGFFFLVWIPFMLIGSGLHRGSNFQVIATIVVWIPLWALVLDQMLPKKTVWIECKTPGAGGMCVRTATPIFGFIKGR